MALQKLCHIYGNTYPWTQSPTCSHVIPWIPCLNTHDPLKLVLHLTRWIHIWWWNDTYSLMLLWRVALLFFNVIRQISRSRGAKNRRIWPRLGVSGLLLQFKFTNGYEILHKAYSGIEEVPYCFTRWSVKFQGHTALKIVEFDPDWAFPDCYSSLNSPMATKCYTKPEVA